MVGYDFELDQAFRVYEGSAKEYTSELEAEAGSSGKPEELDEVFATWPDGHRARISQLTRHDLSELKEKSENSSTRRVTPPLWTGKTQSGDIILVKPRVDRSVLVSVYVNGKQKLQVDVKHCPTQEDRTWWWWSRWW
jgi:hypothetical protein